MIELKEIISNNVDLDQLYTEIFSVFLFDILFIDLPLFVFGQYFYRFSRISALLCSVGSINIKFVTIIKFDNFWYSFFLCDFQ